MSLGRALIRSRSVMHSGLLAENAAVTSSGQCAFLQKNSLKSAILLNVITKRGIKTTDTIHPKPVYDDDERILKKVLEERDQQCEDMPIGMGNPYEKPQAKCILCEHGITPNWKNVKLLCQFTSPYTGMLYERHITGLCKEKHRQVEENVKIAIKLGLMSNYLKEVEFLKDPQLCDPEKPIRPHKY